MKALDMLSLRPDDFLIGDELNKVGEVTLRRLASLGLAEAGLPPRYHGKTGWRITPDGWRCMFGKSYEEIMASGVRPVRPLPVWRWPPLP
jgi:hypothetical protein